MTIKQFYVQWQSLPAKGILSILAISDTSVLQGARIILALQLDSGLKTKQLMASLCIVLTPCLKPVHFKHQFHPPKQKSSIQHT